MTPDDYRELHGPDSVHHSDEPDAFWQWQDADGAWRHAR